MKKQSYLDDHICKRQIKGMLKALGKNELSFVKEHAGFLARDLAFFTPPFTQKHTGAPKRSYGSGKDKKAGEGAIARDILKVLVVREKGFVKFVKDEFGLQNIRQTLYAKDGEPYRLELDSVDITGSSIPAHHKRHRDSRGRVRGSSFDSAWTNINGKLVTVQEYKKYKAKKLKNVGRAKAAFAKAAIQAGVKKQPPKWISRHFSSVSGAAVASKGRTKSVTIIANEPGIGHAFNRLPFLKEVRIKAMRNQLKAIIKAEKKKQRI